MKRRHPDSGWVPAVIVDVSTNGLDHSVRFPGNRGTQEFVRPEDLRFFDRRDEINPDCEQFTLNQQPMPQQMRPQRSQSQPVMKYSEAPQLKPEGAGYPRVNSRRANSAVATAGGSIPRALSLPSEPPPQWLLNWGFFCAEFARGLLAAHGENQANKENDETNDNNIKARNKEDELFDEESQNNQEESKEVLFDPQPDSTYRDKPLDVSEGKYLESEDIDDTADAIEVSSVNINIFHNVPRNLDIATMEEWRQRINVNVCQSKR